MALLLHIDTATPHAGVCLSSGLTVLGWEENADQKSHASFVHPAIQRLLSTHHLKPSDLDGVAVTIGPGSYTGLRVGLSTAKGLCFAASKPLIAINTLELIAYSATQTANELDSETLIVPMIDARRMEVFTAIYDVKMNELQPAHALILDQESFQQFTKRPLLFCGDGAMKYEKFIKEKSNKFFLLSPHRVFDITPLSLQRYQHQQFEDVAYAEPRYGKAFFSPSHRN